MSDNSDVKIGDQKKSGDKCGKSGYWVNKGKREVHYIDAEDIMAHGGDGPGDYERYIWIYAGEKKPNSDEVDRLIKDSPPYP